MKSLKYLYIKNNSINSIGLNIVKIIQNITEIDFEWFLYIGKPYSLVQK